MSICGFWYLRRILGTYPLHIQRDNCKSVLVITATFKYKPSQPFFCLFKISFHLLNQNSEFISMIYVSTIGLQNFYMLLPVLHRKMWMVGMKCVDRIVNEYETRSTGWERVKISVCILRGLYFTGESSTQLLLVVDIFQ